MEYRTRTNGSDANINNSSTLAFTNNLNSNGSVITAPNNNRLSPNTSGYYVAVAMIEGSANVGEGDSRQTPRMRFTKNGTSGRAISEHGYQRTDGLDTGLFIKDVFQLANGDYVDVRTVQGGEGSNGGSWVADYSQSYFRLEEMLVAPGETAPVFLARSSSNGTGVQRSSINSIVTVDFNNTYLSNGSYITYSNSGRFNVSKDGLYRVHAHIAVGSASDQRSSPRLRFRKNGSTYTEAVGEMGYIRASSHFAASVVNEDIITLSNGDYVEAIVQNSGSGGTGGFGFTQDTTLNYGAQSNNCIMWVEYLGPVVT